MSDISKKAKLSKNYTNHTVCKTTATAMKRSGFSLQEITNVTKHKNLESLKHYLAAPTHEEKESYSNALHDYGQKKNTPQLVTKEQQTWSFTDHHRRTQEKMLPPQHKFQMSN